MSALISWELWLDCHLSQSALDDAGAGTAESAATTFSFGKVAFVDLPTMISTLCPSSRNTFRVEKPGKSRLRVSFWRRSGQLSSSLQPQPILKNKFNANEEAELELVRESDNESFDQFHARYEVPTAPPDDTWARHARLVQLGNYYGQAK